MLTLFAIPKAFEGHVGVIQRNALESWKRLRPACDVILLGDDRGTAEAAARLGFRHEPRIPRNASGTPLVNGLFAEAERLSRHELMAYVNADIILLDDFVPAVERAARAHRRFLVVGHRWDLDVPDPLDFADGWGGALRQRLERDARLHAPTGIDYFVFPRGLWGEIPPFAVGRTVWDNWFIFRARSLGVPVLDATDVITAVHQNHGYAHHPGGAAGIWGGEEARRNRALAGGDRNVYDLRDADWRMTASRVRRRPAAAVRDLSRSLRRLAGRR